jgi:hypothetical protein
MLTAMNAWLDHNCILPADLKLISLSTTKGIFDAAFDNPREARLFARRFAGQPILSPTPPRTDRSHLSRLFRFARKLRARGEAHLWDRSAPAIAGARAD